MTILNLLKIAKVHAKTFFFATFSTNSKYSSNSAFFETHIEIGSVPRRLFFAAQQRIALT
jgi:hypothetical protein